MRLAGRDREMIEQTMAIVPGYVFAPFDRADDLLALARSPSLNYRVWDPESRQMAIKGHPYFTVLHMNGRVRSQPDRSLAPLRAIEEDLARLAERRRARNLEKGAPPKFRAGQIVHAGSGGFDGLRLKVVEDNLGKSVKLMHPDWSWPLEVSAWKLHAIQIELGLSVPSAA